MDQIEKLLIIGALFIWHPKLQPQFRLGCCMNLSLVINLGIPYDLPITRWSLKGNKDIEFSVSNNCLDFCSSVSSHSSYDSMCYTKILLCQVCQCFFFKKKQSLTLEIFFNCSCYNQDSIKNSPTSLAPVRDYFPKGNWSDGRNYITFMRIDLRISRNKSAMY